VGCDNPGQWFHLKGCEALIGLGFKMWRKSAAALTGELSGSGTRGLGG